MEYLGTLEYQIKALTVAQQEQAGMQFLGAQEDTDPLLDVSKILGGSSPPLNVKLLNKFLDFAQNLQIFFNISSHYNMVLQPGTLKGVFVSLRICVFMRSSVNGFTKTEI